MMIRRSAACGCVRKFSSVFKGNHIGEPSYSPDFASCDLFLLLKLKWIIKEACLEGMAAIKDGAEGYPGRILQAENRIMDEKDGKMQ